MGDPTLEVFLNQIVPAPYDRTEASARRSVVESALRTSSLRVSSMFESGSWSHGTAIKAKSDVDYMAVASSARPALPSSGLTAARNAIKNCDWKIVSVNVSSPVVQVGYYTPPNFEIVPAWYKGRTAGYEVYWIAGRGDDWVESAPAAHLDYVNRQNDRLSKKVKQLVRLLKAWKYNVGAPISSFYLEMRAAEHCAGESVIVYDIDLRSVMRKIVSFDARDMNDPAHIVGRIPACASDDKRRTSLHLLRSAFSSLESASAARERGDRSAYWRAMYSVFGSDYPYPAW